MSLTVSPKNNSENVTQQVGIQIKRTKHEQLRLRIRISAFKSEILHGNDREESIS